MNKHFLIAGYVFVMVVTIVVVDVLFFRHNFRARLIANVGIVLAYAVLYLAFFRTLI